MTGSRGTEPGLELGHRGRDCAVHKLGERHLAALSTTTARLAARRARTAARLPITAREKNPVAGRRVVPNSYIAARDIPTLPPGATFDFTEEITRPAVQIRID